MQLNDSVECTIPLIVGITGHRDIPEQDFPNLRKLISEQLQGLQREFPNTPLLLLSGLAEGADRLVVQVAIELNVAFSAILPMPQQDYCNDFETLESKREFEQLLASATWVETLQPPKNNNQIATRAECYEQLGVYLARYSHILMALWNGDKAEKIGGTSQVVRYFLSGIPPKFSPNVSSLVFPSYGKVIHLSTRRTSQIESLQESPNQDVSFLWPAFDRHNTLEIQQQRQHNWEAALNQIGTFNLDIKQFLVTEENETKVQNSLGYLLGESSHFEKLDKQAQNIARLFSISDAMSMTAQVKRRLDFLKIILLALVVIIAEQVYGIFSEWSLLASTIGIGFFTYLLYQRSLKHQLDVKYLDYRALAEALRVQFFWHIAGVSANVADHFLRDQQDELEWLRLAIQSLELPELPKKLMQTRQLEFILERWIRDQRMYFIGDQLLNKGKYFLNQQKNDELGSKIRYFFMTGLLLIISTLIFHVTLYDTWSLEWRDYVLNLGVASYGTMFWIVPTIKLYADFQAYDEQSKRYLRIGNYYALCENQLVAIVQGNSDFNANDLLVEMGRQALLENSDWLQLHRQRPSQVPIL